jgi:hypothetical protein
MTKYIKKSAAPEVQAQTTSSQAPQTQNNDLQSADKEPRVHPSEKYVIIINPLSEHKLGLVNIQYKKLGPCNASCEYQGIGTIVRLWPHNTLLAAHNVVFRNEKRTTKYVLKGLNSALNPRDIQSELVEDGFEVVELTNMVSWVTKRPLPMFKLI